MEPKDPNGRVPREAPAEPTQSSLATEGSRPTQPQGHGAQASESPRKQPGQDGSSPAKTVGRFSVVSTQDEWTLASPRGTRYSAPPDVYLDEVPSSPDVKLAVRRVQTASSIEVGVGEPASSDSGDECPRRRPPVQKQSSLPSGGSGVASDLVKKATAFLHRSSRAGSLGPETPSRAGVKVPTISVTSFHSQSSYISSDNDSEFEDADIKKELRSLREKYVPGPRSPSLWPCEESPPFRCPPHCAGSTLLPAWVLASGGPRLPSGPFILQASSSVTLRKDSSHETRAFLTLSLLICLFLSHPANIHSPSLVVKGHGHPEMSLGQAEEPDSEAERGGWWDSAVAGEQAVECCLGSGIAGAHRRSLHQSTAGLETLRTRRVSTGALWGQGGASSSLGETGCKESPNPRDVLEGSPSSYMSQRNLCQGRTVEGPKRHHLEPLGAEGEGLLGTGFPGACPLGASSQGTQGN